jgi:hypothetical protein
MFWFISWFTQILGRGHETFLDSLEYAINNLFPNHSFSVRSETYWCVTISALGKLCWNMCFEYLQLGGNGNNSKSSVLVFLHNDKLWLRFRLEKPFKESLNLLIDLILLKSSLIALNRSLIINKFNTYVTAQICQINNELKEVYNYIDLLTLKYIFDNPSFNECQNFILDELKKVYSQVNFSIIEWF